MAKLFDEPQSQWSWLSSADRPSIELNRWDDFGGSSSQETFICCKDIISRQIAFPDWQLTADLLVAEGEYVAALVTGRGTHQGIFADVPATGRSMRLPVTIFHQLRGGRLVADWEVVNTEPFMRALRAANPSSTPPN